MTNKIKEAFDNIKAEERLKQSTMSFLERNMKKRNYSPIRRYAAVMASIALIIFAGFSSYKLYFSMDAVLDIDVNPSIELTLNRFDRVIAADAYNKDGKELLRGVSIENKSYKKALELLIREMADLGYLKDSGLFSATLQTNSSKTEKEMLGELESHIDDILKANHKDVEQNIFKVDQVTKAKSHDAHVSPAKYMAIMELQSLDPTVTIDSCQNHSISDLNQQIEKCKNKHGQEQNNSGVHHRHKKHD